MAYNGGKFFGPRYFGPRYWGTKQVVLPPGSMSMSALGAATCSGSLTALGHMTANAPGLAVFMATLTAKGHMTVSMAGSSTMGGTLTDGGAPSGFMTVSMAGSSTLDATLTYTGAPVEQPDPGFGGRGAGGPVRKARKKKKKLTPEEELEIARLRGTLRKLEDLFAAPERSFLPSWEEMKNDWEIEIAPDDVNRSANPGPAFMIPETDSFEKISDASRRVVDQLLEEARRRAAATELSRQELVKHLAEEDDEDDIELLLLDLL